MHTGQSGVKGGSKPQSTPHPSYARKNSMSSSPPSLPHAVPLLLPLSLLLLLCAPSMEMNHLTLRGFCSFCKPIRSVAEREISLSKLFFVVILSLPPRRNTGQLYKAVAIITHSVVILVMCISLADQLENSATGAAVVKEGSEAPQGSLMGFQWVI